ncbi:MAG: GIY-YIG nuclease family protein [Pseudanabaenaceae cyanobacterium SKYGB_i_bin29]|nr:GIY-YIG nuclease family protein [Pseudanabaenaceae cyanobacterium SKYG29]MDW8420806.1 GIY-YIG nuclease family protein [Pseudanabaenaceae cyanobacterium SKYGB_i_bin29]
MFGPLELPSLHLSNRKQLPACSAVYFVMDSNNIILYVGKAKNLSSRWRNHHRLFEFQKFDRQFPLRIAWKVCDEKTLDEVERRLIEQYRPPLNNREVETEAVVPAEIVLKDFLKTFSRRLIIFGIEYPSSTSSPSVHLRYDWTDCSSKGTTAKIKAWIKQNKDKNTNLRFRHYKIIDFAAFSGETFRPGSRAQRKTARQHRSFNNRWEVACNGVVIHIKPVFSYKEYKEKTKLASLAGIRLRAITQEAFIELQKSKDCELSGLSCFTSDPVPLLWKNLYT